MQDLCILRARVQNLLFFYRDHVFLGKHCIELYRTLHDGKDIQGGKNLSGFGLLHPGRLCQKDQYWPFSAVMPTQTKCDPAIDHPPHLRFITAKFHQNIFSS